MSANPTFAITPLIVGSVSAPADFGPLVKGITFPPAAQQPWAAVTPGVGAGQCNLWYDDIRSLAASTTENLDLNGGGMVDAFGGAVNFARVNVFAMSSDPANLSDITVGNVTNGVVLFLGAAAQSIVLRPGQCVLFTNLTATGWPITAATADLLKIANGAGGTANYSILLGGRDS